MRKIWKTKSQRSTIATKSTNVDIIFRDKAKSRVEYSLVFISTIILSYFTEINFKSQEPIEVVN